MQGVEEAVNWRKSAKSKPSQTSNKSDPNQFSRTEGRLDGSVCLNINVQKRREEIHSILTNLCYGQTRMRMNLKSCLKEARKNERHNKRIMSKKIVYLHELRDNRQPCMHQFDLTTIVDAVLELHGRLPEYPSFTYFVLGSLYLLQSRIESMPNFPELRFILPETNKLNFYTFDVPINKRQFTDAKTSILRNLRKSINKKESATK